MTFTAFCKVHNLSKEEKRQAKIFLLAIRLIAMWEAFMEDDDD